MEIMRVKDYGEMSRAGANLVKGELRKKPTLASVLASGSSQVGFLGELSGMGLNFSLAKFFNLDEYFGLRPDHPQSFNLFLRRNFLNLINADPKNVHLLSGLIDKGKVSSYCRDYEKLIAESGGLDLVILGIGRRTGHIAFNEPGSPFNSTTRLVKLSGETIHDNSRFFSAMSDVPEYAISMGISTIMSARMIMLLASGKEKADILAKALQGPVTEQVPASILQRHQNAIIISDEAAASKLKP